MLCRIPAKYFRDATGASRLGLGAGASMGSTRVMAACAVWWDSPRARLPRCLKNVAR